MALKPVSISLDGKLLAARPGQNLLEACLSAKRDVPYFCWHPALGSVGSCRQCAVKLFRGAEDSTGEIVMACMTPVREGMRVAVADAEAARFREAAVEMVLTNHPHDCAVCEVGGDCHLQDMAVLTGHSARRYRFGKRTHLNQDLGPFIRHEMNRCIGCYRCVRFYRDHAGGEDFGVFGANRNIYFGRAENGPLESPFAGNLVEVCPTGVFVDKPFSARFRRKWDMRSTPSVCGHCAIGCNITLQERDGTLRRVVNRFNPTLNGYFLCDRGRFGVDFVASPKRLTTSRLASRRGTHEVLSPTEARATLATVLKQKGVIGIGSPRASIEANFALRSLVGPENFYAGISAHDGAILAAAAAILRQGGAPIASLDEVEDADSILILGDDPARVAPRLALALRQATQRPRPEHLAARGIPAWQDDAVRRLAAEFPTPLAIVTPLPTQVDAQASLVHHAAPAAIARLAIMTARQLDGTGETESPDPIPGRLASMLLGDAAPLVVAGGDPAVMLAAAHIVIALRRHGKLARLCLTLPEANSLGLGLLDPRPLADALSDLTDGKAAHVVVLENDLFRRAPSEIVTAAVAAATTLAVLDHVDTATAAAADLTLAVASYAESDGIFINSEGRAQPFFKAIFGEADPSPSWHLLRDAGVAAGRLPDECWASHRDLLVALGAAVPELAGCADVLPRYAARPPSLPHRYSGRTAVTADRDVREPAPPVHPDTPFATTMEGLGGDASPLNWSPGWNSGQAVFKHQREIGGSVADGIVGIRLFAGAPVLPGGLDMPKIGVPQAGLCLIARACVFGSEELSNLSPAILARMTPPTVSVHPEDARRYDLTANATVLCGDDRGWLRRKVVIDPSLPVGVAAVDSGFPGDPFVAMPGPGEIRRITGDPA